jgi:hypothetical protein
VCCFTVLEIRRAVSHLAATAKGILPSDRTLANFLHRQAVCPFAAVSSRYRLVVYSHNGSSCCTSWVLCHVQVFLPTPGRESSKVCRRSWLIGCGSGKGSAYEDRIAQSIVVGWWLHSRWGGGYGLRRKQELAPRACEESDADLEIKLAFRSEREIQLGAQPGRRAANSLQTKRWP